MAKLFRYLFFLFLSCSLVGAEEVPYEYFPLKKGTFWVYQAHLRYTTGDSSKGTVKTKEKDMTYRVEVADTLQNESIFVARLHGFPGDLDWYKEGQEIYDHLIVRVSTGCYYLISLDVDEIWKKLQQGEFDCLKVGLDSDSALLETPLKVSNSVRRYCYSVEGSSSFDPSQIKNYPNLPHARSFDIGYHANPEHIVFSFVPGLGITSYEYEHHGTIAEASLDLIEYGPAATSRKNKCLRAGRTYLYLYQSK